ncbi:uncharacterized protein LACBIDRAFT_306563 [Laccaria bicolor S238N-H82]|uniref:Predicted protein n=1 Tax=Laccaria bicolor (strain S238N-H82 / ATCC MYA-4686) TaxID=486041 RepID=B0DNB6_LACBS|nr:uncharacterized protein LACBIDRAFT_306563 [Laccaria bicolor S238N-H82]EDR03839.1 predicted protein [Laccaria bicolor S238N-H82]|eukprot:XP_001885407.1 predicted protein [Laccaria bicolor S238N-H82]
MVSIARRVAAVYIPWSFFDTSDLNTLMPMEAVSSDVEEAFIRFMASITEAPAQQGTHSGPLPTDPPASASGFTYSLATEHAPPPVALNQPALQPLLPSPSGAQSTELIPESSFPLPHGIEAYALANRSVAVEDFRGYLADLTGIFPLYAPKSLMNHLCPVAKMHEEGAQRTNTDVYLFINVHFTSIVRYILPHLEEYFVHSGLMLSSDKRRVIYTSQSKILLRDEVFLDETYHLWQHLLFVPIGRPNTFLLEPLPAAVTFGQWSAWLGRLADDLPPITTFYPRWAPKLAICLSACQIAVQCEVLCGQFLHDADLQDMPSQKNLKPRVELQLRRAWDNVCEAFSLPEAETAVRWNDASPMLPLGQDPFLKPLVAMQSEIGRNIRIIIRFIVRAYLVRNRDSPVEFIENTFQLSIANLAAGIVPAVTLEAAEKTMVSPKTGCPFAHPLLFIVVHYLMNRGVLLSQPLPCDPRLPPSVAAFFRKATATQETPAVLISYVATELLAAILRVTCEDPEVAAFPPFSAATMHGIMFDRYTLVMQISRFSSDVKKLARLLMRAYSLKPRMIE